MVGSMINVPKRMKAAVLHAPNNLKVEEVATPEINSHEVLVKVKYCGVCGTDYHICNGTFPIGNLPLILGHEYSGVVAKKGEEVKSINIGDSVTADVNMSCEMCDYCRKGYKFFCPELRQKGIHEDGAFAEYIKVTDRYIHKLPKSMPFEAGAFVEPVACVVHSHERLNIKLGSSVAIIGAGTMGLIHASVARLRGATKIIISEVNQYRLEHAGESGGDYIIDSNKYDLVDEVMKITENKGVDYVIEAAGSLQTYKQALNLMGRGGSLLVYGAYPENELVGISPYDIQSKEKTLLGSYAGSYETWNTAAALIASNRIDINKLLSKKISLEEMPEVLEKADKRHIKVLVSPEL
jgi:2-desacetyl-2-hydroxyethyl bacteriochlorophyllide A dehydrogenase